MIYTGMDTGSTTVKAVVMNEEGEILWKKYERHNTRQAERVRDFLDEISAQFPGKKNRIFITGSGGRGIASFINSFYVQEVNAVTFAVEKLHPNVGSVIELGGQDAKAIIWKEDEHGEKNSLTFMNDKCAGGTGATLDKVLAKIGVTSEEAAAINKEGKSLHHIAAKCGVFAETDVVGLLKSGVNREEIVVSLCAAIINQNLEVLVHGHLLHETVVLLGGPNTFLPVFQELWRDAIQKSWKLHLYTPPANKSIEEMVIVPDNSQYYAAMGSVFFGQENDKIKAASDYNYKDDWQYFNGLSELDHYIHKGRLTKLEGSGAIRDGLLSDGTNLEEFSKKYSLPEFKVIEPKYGETLKVMLGLDGGSTSTKLVLTDTTGHPIYKDYVLSQGNPIDDVSAIFKRLQTWVKDTGVILNIIGTGVTGYAANLLKDAFCFDIAIVETVAHMRSAVNLYGDVDVICDIGGQDIKILFMKHGRVVDFKLNTQCSAGNGYFLQGMAEQFGIPIEKYADHAFQAKKAPAFNYGCAVFMEQDRVNFQQLGWSKEEIMAGLALVLPFNVWNYVVQEPNLEKFGNRFVLQGGTQKNLAAVKSQIDYINNRVSNAEIHVHKYADIGGAIGAAIEVGDQMTQTGAQSNFIGIDRSADIKYTSLNNEDTRCKFCNNRCTRTFIDIDNGSGKIVRSISGFGCEKGQTEDFGKMKNQVKETRIIYDKYPDLVREASKLVFKYFVPKDLPKTGESPDGFLKFNRSSEDAAKKRSEMVIGIPKLLNMYYYAPFFSTYFRSLGVKDVVYSDYTSAQLWQDGNKWGSIDPCFPAKVAPAHIWNLLKKKNPTHIVFPMITNLGSELTKVMGNTACVIQMGTPEVVHAAFDRERNQFKEHGVEYWKPRVNMEKPEQAEGLMFEYFQERLGITHDENAWAIKQSFEAMRTYLDMMENRGREVINQVINDDSMAILVLGHPYHHDPGLNHGIPEEFRKRGFPIMCIESLPRDEEFLRPLFPMKGKWDLSKALEINGIWDRNFNRNTNLKVWAANIASRHPNIAVIDLSSFKCGHDAPTYSYIDNLLDASKTPHFLFHDLDQNKPGASINIRIQTIEYFLKNEESKLRNVINNNLGV